MLHIKNLSKLINKNIILDDISVDIKENEVIAIIGKNGAGKSTLIKLILNLMDGYSGNIMLFNKDIRLYKRCELAREISYLPQANNTNTELTVYDIILSGRYSHNRMFSLQNISDKMLVDKVMRLTSVYELRYRKISELSGGEKQRVYIASSLAQGSRVLLLDEPSVFLDPKSSQEVYDMLAMLNKEEGLTLIIVSHDINQLLQMRARLIGLKDGRLAFDISDGKVEDNLLDKLYDKNFKYIKHPETGITQIIP